MSATVEASAPVSHTELSQFAQSACEKAFGNASSYNHDSAESWNHAIINGLLKSLVDASSSSSESDQPSKRYKYAVTSTIIQHLDAPGSTSTGTSMKTESGSTPIKQENGLDSSTSVKPSSGRRGMHSATGAYWNNETDGMWTYKWDGAESRGCDAVISIIWVTA